MSNIELILESYNLKQQGKIFAEKDKIKGAKKLYFERVNQTKDAYQPKINEVKVKITESKVYLKYLKGEIKLELKRYKLDFLKKSKKLKEEYKLAQLEIKDNSKLHLEKVETIIKRQEKDYLDQISSKAINLNIDEREVLELEDYQTNIKNLVDKHERKVLKITKQHYLREKKKYYRLAILNADDKNPLRAKRSEFLKDYNLNIKKNPNASLAELQKALVLSNDYKYHLQSLVETFEYKKQKLINNTYKKHQNEILENKLMKAVDEENINKIKSTHEFENILTRRVIDHNKTAEALQVELEQFRKDTKQFFEEEKNRTNSLRDQELERLRLKYESDLEKAKKDFENKKTKWETKYYNPKQVIKLKEQLEKAESNEQKSKLRNEIKLCNFVYGEKVKHKALIKSHQETLRSIKAEKLASIKTEKPTYLQYKEEMNKEIASAKQNIKTLEAERKEYYKSLSPEEKKVYNKYEKYARQERVARVRLNLDDAEKKVFKRINTAYIYVLPAFFSALIFTIFPFVFMTVGSLFKLDLTNLSQSHFVGFTNYYNNFVLDREFQMGLYNTIIYSIMTIVLLSVVTIGMAAWLARDTKIHNITQTMVFTPHIASFVAISILWMAMLKPEGIINQALAIFGIQGPGWLVTPNTALLSVSFVTVWKDIGYYVLIIISGLQSIPAYVYEAAQLDKASKSTQFFKLTLPLLTPTLSFVFITKFINSFKVFTPIEIMTSGGPMGHSMVLSYWIYKMGRVGYNYGTAMAGAVVLTVLIASFTFVNNRFSRRTVRYY